MRKNKEQDELNKWLEKEAPFGLHKEIKTILFTFLDCGKEDDVPEGVVQEFWVGKKSNEGVETECPKCGEPMHRAKKDPKRFCSLREFLFSFMKISPYVLPLIK
jgi:hypothetical protein